MQPAALNFTTKVSDVPLETIGTLAGIQIVRNSSDEVACAVDLASLVIDAPREVSSAAASVKSISPGENIADIGAVDLASIGRIVPSEHVLAVAIVQTVELAGDVGTSTIYLTSFIVGIPSILGDTGTARYGQLYGRGVGVGDISAVELTVEGRSHPYGIVSTVTRGD